MDLSSVGDNLADKVETLKQFNQFNPTNIMFRKFLKILITVTNDYQEKMNLKDFLYQKKGFFIDQLNKRYFDPSNTDIDISKTTSS